MLYKLLYLVAWTGFLLLSVTAFYNDGKGYLWRELKKLSSQYARDHNPNCIYEDFELLRKLFEDVNQTSLSALRASVLILSTVLYLVGVAIIFIL